MGVALATPGAVQARGPADDEPWGTFYIAPAGGHAGTVIHVIGYCVAPSTGPGVLVEITAFVGLQDGGPNIAGATVPLPPFDTAYQAYQAYQLFDTTLTVPAGTPDGIYKVTAGCAVSLTSVNQYFAYFDSLPPHEGRPFHVPPNWVSVFQPAILGLDVVTGRALSDVRGSLGLLGFGADQPSTGTTTIPSTAPPAPGDVPIPAPSPPGRGEEETATTTTSTTTTTSPRR